jgi:hypothetical protein
LSRKRITSPNQFRPTVEQLERREVPALVVPAYSSLAGAAATLYLDFDGHFESSWGSYGSISSPAYDIDGNANDFSATELANIEQIWKFVAEDYAPFKINVTTVLPSSFANGVSLRVVIGGNSSWAGGTYGGVAYVNSFTNSIVNTAYVFPANLGNGYPKYVGDAASHEAGHAFGLQHQSAYSGSTMTATYQSGPGDGTAPLMGNSYSATRSLWWYGASTSSSTLQNDMEIISNSTNGFGYRADDYGNSLTAATWLNASTGSFNANGIISQMTDTDWFSFTTGAGNVTLNVDVSEPHNNLDARLDLYDANGNFIAFSSPGTGFDANLSLTLGAGTYFAVVSSTGVSSNATANNYGFNVGQYKFTGTLVASVATAPNAPSSLAASAASSTAINLSWADNSNNETGFRIERWNGSSWVTVATVGANTTTWSNTGLTASTSYTYRVCAYNSVGDSAMSNQAAATTSAAPTLPSTPASLSAAASSTSAISLSWTDSSTNESGFKIERLIGSTWTEVATVGANVTGWTNTGLSASTSYSFRVRAFNEAGNSSYSPNASATTLTPTETVPNAPSNLKGTVQSTGIVLSWWDNANNETGFVIERSSGGGSFSVIATVGANVTTYTDGTGQTGNQKYRVRAFNTAGYSAYSNQINLKVSGGAKRGGNANADASEDIALITSPNSRGIAVALEHLIDNRSRAREHSLVFDFEAELNENVMLVDMFWGLG